MTNQTNNPAPGSEPDQSTKCKCGHSRTAHLPSMDHCQVPGCGCWRYAPDLGPQRDPASVQRIEAQTKQANRELASPGSDKGEGPGEVGVELDLAADIRNIDGKHILGAAALARQLVARGWINASTALAAKEAEITERGAFLDAAEWKLEQNADVIEQLRKQNQQLTSRVAEFRKERDEAADLANKWEWRWKDDNAVWLETRDSNQRLSKESDEAKQLAAIVLSGLEWTGGEYDYRMRPEEAVDAMKRDREKLKAKLTAAESELATLRQKLAEAKPKVIPPCDECGCMNEPGDRESRHFSDCSKRVPATTESEGGE